MATTRLGDTFEITEVWKGVLNPGEKIVVPELCPLNNARPLRDYPVKFEELLQGGVVEQIPKQPVGSRLILFLKREVKETSGQNENVVWKPSDTMDSMKASVVWIDEDQIYVFGQEMNPGPSVLHPWLHMFDQKIKQLEPASQGRIRERVDEFNLISRRFDMALSITEPMARAEALKPFVVSDANPVKMDALKLLRKCGIEAVPVVREMLDDPAFENELDTLISIYAEAGGESVAMDLNLRLQRELAFWQQVGPSLRPGWWNDDPTPESPLRRRYGITLELVRDLQKTHYRPAVIAASQLRDFWRSFPQLNDPSSLNQISIECDKLVTKLNVN